MKKFKISKRGGGGCVFHNKLKMACARNFNAQLTVILIWWMENMSGVALVFKISENLLQSKTFLTSCKLPYFSKIRQCACLIYAHRTFLRKTDSYLENYKFTRRFEGLRLKQIS